MGTANKILNASISLFSQKGYEAVTIKEIAKEAGVSEMTIFRHFISKRNLFEKAFEEFVFTPRFKHLFENRLEWELEKDLLKISHVYQETLLKNQQIILMAFKNDNGFSEGFKDSLLKFPNELRKLLADYLTKMKQKGLLNQDPNVLAVNFLAANFGFFITYAVAAEITGNTNKETCLTNYITNFVKGITS